MRAFEYANPTSKEEAVRLLKEAGAEGAVLAGGTDLLSLLKDHVLTPSRLVNIKSIRELHGITETPSGLRIGALVTIEELLEHPRIGQEYPCLQQAAEGIRSPQIRSVGTVGGELCQRPRCWYFRKGFGLLALHNGKSMVVEGDNRYHAILGNTGPAYFVHPSSLAPALIALGGRVKIFGSGGEREVALKDFYRIPPREGEKEHLLQPDELLTEVLVPSAGSLRTATYEVRQKEALDWPLATASVALEMDGNQVRRASVVLGHVAPVPWPSDAAAQALSGRPLNEETAQEAAAKAVEGARALSRNGYKIRLARVAVKRALLRATGKEV